MNKQMNNLYKACKQKKKHGTNNNCHKINAYECQTNKKSNNIYTQFTIDRVYLLLDQLMVQFLDMH